ncbi:MAG: c-type cytochrome [Polyangiaceae bacterium]
MISMVSRSSASRAPRFSILLFAALFTAAGAAACGASESTGGGTPDAGKDSSLGDATIKTETVFARNCATCHGDDGQGSSAAPQIQSPVPGFATYVIRNGRASSMGFSGAMPVATEAALSQAELDEILTFLGSFPKPTDGEGLFKRFCANCHGAGAAGGRVKRSIVKEAAKGDSGLISMVRKGHGGTDYAKTADYMPSWTAEQITDAEIKLIGTHVRGL